MAKLNYIEIRDKPRSKFWISFGVVVIISAIAFSGELLLEIHKWWGYINK